MAYKPLSFDSVLRHEIGHSWKSNFEQLSGLKVADLFEQAKAETRQNLTQYSGENADEWFAESFCCYTHPNYLESDIKIYPPLLAAFEKIIPRRRR